MRRRSHEGKIFFANSAKEPTGAIAELIVQEVLLTTEQVARYLKVDKFTVYRLAKQRRIPAFKVGNQWRYKKKLIDAWLLENSNISGHGSDRETTPGQ
jgi:excisionase family DNA binding protein